MRSSRPRAARCGAKDSAPGATRHDASREQQPATPYVPRPGATQYKLRVGATTLNPDGQKEIVGITANGSFPGPEVRAREGDRLRIEVENALGDDRTTIHWHGLLVPAGMDGVPEISNLPIDSKRVYVYEYPLLQSGTYWYHSHWRLQEQVGLAGPLVIEPRDEPLRVDHDAVVMLGDWLHRSPYQVFDDLKKGPTQPEGKGPDLSDVDYASFLLNGRGKQDLWTLAARPKERIRLRIINGGASTYFRLRLDDHPLEVTHADGRAVEPVTVDHLLMGMAEVYDVVVALSRSGSFTLHAVSQDGSDQAVGVLHTPDVAPTPNLTIPGFDGRALAYADLRAVAPTTLPAGERRPLRIDLQGDMKRYVWMLNGQAYPKADPFLIRQGERVEIEMVNQTMMWHPMHLHGHFFRVLQGAGEHCPLMHTVNVAPRETVRIEFTADNPGQWFFHCHNLYHLDAGMARVFQYEA
jgi:multicopper oxidase